jgi:predicted RNA-binding Zn-ribbon protein involved in translation (DUF1610 family)
MGNISDNEIVIFLTTIVASSIIALLSHIFDPSTSGNAYIIIFILFWIINISGFAILIIVHRKRLRREASPKSTICPICNSAVSSVEQFVECPHCGCLSYREHLLEWIKVNKYCPKCGESLKETDIV